MCNPGKSLERLVTALEQATTSREDIKVECGVRVANRVTGQLREHDVLLTITAGQHVVLTALECRDRSRPVGVPDVEAFHAKCDRTVDKGVIVSASGFTDTALNEARSRGIACLTLDDAEQFDWLQMGALKVRTAKPTSSHLQINTRLPSERIAMVYHKELGELSDSEALNELRNRLWFNRPHEEPAATEELGQSHKWSCHVDPSEFFAIDREGNHVPVGEVTFTCTYTITEELSPFELHTYGDAERPEARYAIASAAMRLRGQAADLRMIRLPDSRTKILIQKR